MATQREKERGLTTGRWFAIGSGKRRVLLILAAAVLTGYWLNSAVIRPNVPSRTQGLIISEKDLNFGAVWETPTFEWSMTIANPTTKDVKIQRFATSCNCLSIQPSELVVPAEGSATVRLTMSLMLTSRKDAERDEQDVEIQLAPELNDGALPGRAWTLRGRVQRLLRLSPRELYFGTGLVGEQVSVAQTVEAVSKTPLDDLVAKCDPSKAAVEVERCADKRNTFQIMVKPKAGMQPGLFKFSVDLQPIRGMEKLPRVTLPVSGIARADIQAIPEFLHFGVQPLGKTMTETIVLRAASRRDFTIEAVKLPSEEVTVSLVDVPDAGEKVLRITQRIAKMGKQDGKVVFSLRQGFGTPPTVTVPLIYIGTAAK